MAIGTPVGLGFVTTGASGTSLTLTTSAAVTAGDSIIVGATVNSRVGVVSSVTDSAGNVYTIEKQQAHASVNLGAAVASCHNALALSSGGTITVTWSANVSDKHIGAATVSGLAATGTADQTAGNQGTGTAWSSGATSATTQASELAIGVAHLGSTTASTPDAPWSEIYDSSTSSRRFQLVSQVLSATGAVTASGVAGNSSWTAVAATYKAAATGTTYTDSPTGALTLAGTQTDAATRVSSPTGAISAAGARVEALSAADVPTGALLFAGTITESSFIGFADVVTGALALTGTVAEANARTTSIAGTLGLTGTLADALARTTAVAGTLALAGAIVESYGPGFAVIVADGGTPLFVELTTLHYPDTPSKVLAVVQQYEGLEIPIALNDSRTAKIDVSIYDDAVWQGVHDYLGGTDDIAYWVMVRVRYYGKPVFWGVITVPDWQGETAKVTLNAVDRSLGLQHAYLRYGDETIDGTLDAAMNEAKGARFPVTTHGLRLLRDAGKNDANETTHGVPDLGVIDGSVAAAPVDLDPVPLVPFRRHDEVWRSMLELASHDLAPDFELDPVFDVPGAYARLNCAFPQGTDRTGAVRFYYGFAADNLADANPAPGGKIVTRQTAVTGDGKRQKVVTAWGSAAERGIYGAVDPVDYDSKGDELGDILALKAKQQIRAYRVPPKFLKVVMKPEAAISDPMRRHRYGRDFLVGDTVHVEVKKGWMRYSGDARITKVTLRQTAPATVVPELELVPDVGEGTVDITDT